MKKSKLRFLLSLHENINQGCEILAVDRATFMPTLDRFFETVSLGIEMGLKMKGSKSSLAAKKPVAAKGKAKKSVAAKGEAKAKKSGKGGSRKHDPQRTLNVLTAVKTHLGKTSPMRLKDIIEAVKPLLKGIKDPQQAVWKMLTDCPEIESVPKQRGFYRLKPSKKVLNGKANGKATHAVALN